MSTRATSSHPPPAMSQLPKVYRRRSARCHSCSNRPRAEPGRGEDRRVEALALPAGGQERRQRPGGISAGQLGDGRTGERVGGVRGGGRAAEGAVEAGERGHRAAHHGQVELEAAESVPLAGGPRRVALRRTRAGRARAPPRAAPGGPARAGGCGGDRPDRRGGGWCGRPGSAMAAPHGGSPAAGQRVEQSAVRDDDEPERAGVSAAQPGPLGRPTGQRAPARRATARWAGQATAVTWPTWTADGVS